jgi:hypothetical protein
MNLPYIAWVSARQLIKSKRNGHAKSRKTPTRSRQERTAPVAGGGAIVDDHTLSMKADWENVMAAYMIVRITITEEKKSKQYRTAVVPLIAKFGGKI